MVCFAPPPLLNELRAIPSGSHHLPLFSLSLALISPMCTESYLKPTKTSSTSLPGSRGDASPRRRAGTVGRLGRRGEPEPRSEPPQRRPRPQTLPGSSLSPLGARPPGFYFMDCLFKEDLLGHPERTRGEEKGSYLPPPRGSEARPGSSLSKFLK